MDIKNSMLLANMMSSSGGGAYVLNSFYKLTGSGSSITVDETTGNITGFTNSNFMRTVNTMTLTNNAVVDIIFLVPASLWGCLISAGSFSYLLFSLWNGNLRYGESNVNIYTSIVAGKTYKLHIVCKTTSSVDYILYDMDNSETVLKSGSISMGFGSNQTIYIGSKYGNGDSFDGTICVGSSVDGQQLTVRS